MIMINEFHDDRIRQGDVIRDVVYFEHMVENEGDLTISMITFPSVVVLTQDCDLEQDFNYRNEEHNSKDKLLISVLVAPLYNSDHVFNGEHLSEIGITSASFNKIKTEGKQIFQNKNPRYHYLEFPESVQLVPSIVDFKHYFSIPVSSLLEEKKKSYVCTFSELNRADLSQRFASFLSRIGLPEVNINKTSTF